MPETQIRIDVDKHSTLLLLGKGATNHSLKKVSYETDYVEVLEKYGESDLSKAFKIAKDAGAEYIFLMNVKNSYDYFDICETIKQSDFTYIVPVSVYMSDMFIDPYQNDARISYVAYLLSLVSIPCHESVIVATDKHASLYEDIDAFLDGQAQAEDLFRRSCSSGMNMENIIFVANNLRKHAFANVELASALCTADIPEYPSGNFGAAVFDIDSFDSIGNFAFFKNHSSHPTTVENLLNFLDRQPEKIVSISRIMKMIKREIDFGEFVGRAYSEYQRMRIERKLELYLGGLMGYVIYRFRINSVQGYKDSTNPCCIKVLNDFDVWPVNCLERCHVDLEVDV